MSFFDAQVQGMKSAFASRMAYRLDFFISLLIMIANVLLGPLLTLLIYTGGASFPRYTIYEALLIQGTFYIATGIASVLFFGIVGTATSLVREGTLDILLLRPHSLIASLMTASYDIDGFGNILCGIFLFVFSAIHIRTAGFAGILLFVLLLIPSVFVLFGFSVFLASLSIVWIGNSRLFEVYDVVSRFAMYPATIYTRLIRVFVTFIIPVAMIGFIPSSVLLGKADFLDFMSIPCTFVFVCVALLLWRHMIRRYTGAGG